MPRRSRNRGFPRGKRAFSGLGPSRRCQNSDGYPRMARSRPGDVQNEENEAGFAPHPLRDGAPCVPASTISSCFPRENTHFPCRGFCAGARTMKTTPAWPDLALETSKMMKTKPDLSQISAGSEPELSLSSAGFQLDLNGITARSQANLSRIAACSQPDLCRISAGSQPDLSRVFAGSVFAGSHGTSAGAHADPRRHEKPCPGALPPTAIATPRHVTRRHFT